MSDVQHPQVPPPPGWYDDGAGAQRWWTGTEWATTGAPYIAPAVQVQVVLPPRNPPATASLVLGIIGVLPALTIVGLVFSPVPAVLAVIFGFIGHYKASVVKVGSRTSIAGLCLGFAPLAIWVIVASIGAASNNG